MSPAISPRRSYQGFGYQANTAIGVEAGALQQLLERLFVEATSRPVLLSPKLEALVSLRKAFSECCKENWDGEGALPISMEAYKEAYNFIGLLPTMLPMPEVVPSPNGQIGLEWFLERNYVLVVALAGRQSITYASLYGTTAATSRILPFTGAIPPEVIDILSKLNDRLNQNPR